MLIDDVARAVAVPRVDPASSFVLHAPLELLARAILMARSPQPVPEAEDRLRELLAGYVAAGEPVDPPWPVVDDTRALGRRLVDALRAGDLDDIDVYAAAFGDRATAGEARAILGPAVVRSLGAAGHASILLNLLGRVEVGVGLLRGPARELGRDPDWAIAWLDEPGPGAGLTLAEAVLQVPMLGEPGSNFIYPVVHQAEQSGVAAKLLSDSLDVGVAAARPVLTRAAAWSMVQEPGAAAPYGWTHCLTIPQAVLGVGGDERTAVGVAATYVVAFRAAMGQRALDADYCPDRPDASLAEAIAAGPGVAGAAGWHGAPSAVAAELAARALAHPDAHVVKYALACIDAAAADPDAERLYLAAACCLLGWWATSTSS